VRIVQIKAPDRQIQRLMKYGSIGECQSTNWMGMSRTEDLNGLLG
jgi:hypothetical protein